ncbi:MAG: glycosyltransferase, partial [Deltaproteobacteria bacterium]|nr:glycosyltransferase [Deltaproteobacteria bacterium]
MLRHLERSALRLALCAADPWRRAVRATGAVCCGLRGQGTGVLSQPVRVLIEVGTLDRGGLEEVVHDLVVHLDRDRFLPIIACVQGGGWVAERLKARGEQVEIVGGRHSAYRALLARERISLVNSHYSTFGAPLALRAGIPNVHVLHNSYLWLDHGGARRLSWKLGDIGHFVAVSSSVAAWARSKLQVPAARVEVIPNGIDVQRLAVERDELRRVTRSELGLEDGAVVFLLLGTYEPRKGHRAFLSAFARIAREHPQAVAVFAGNAPDARYLEEIRARAGAFPNQVRLLDFERSPARLLAAADAFVLPSVVEGFSLSTLEAAAFGLPLLLTDTGGAADLLGQGPQGILLPGYLDDLAAAGPEQIERAQREPPARVVTALENAMVAICARRDQWRLAVSAGPELVRRA